MTEPTPGKKILRGVQYHNDEGTYSVYRYYKTGRPIFEIAVDKNDPLLKIHVGTVHATWAIVNQIDADTTFTPKLFVTNGHAQFKTDANGTRISRRSVYVYIAPRAFAILANLYVPKPAITTDSTVSLDND